MQGTSLAALLDRADSAALPALGGMPAPTLNFNGIPFPGVGCNCAPPDTNGEVGATQYVQIVNEGFQVFNKSTGASVFGPVGISTVWGGFGGVCETTGDGDPVVLYDQLANRWVLSQFAGSPVPTDECIAVSTTNDATGSWNRYGFHLGSDFFDYPHLGVWPDAYYMSMNVFNSSGSAFLGPQPFAFNRAAMLAGTPATFVTTRDPAVFNSSNDALLAGDLDGSAAPPAGAPAPFLMSGTAATWRLWRYHADFGTPGNSTFTLAGNLSPAGYTELCPTTRNCVPQLGTTSRLDGIGDRGMCLPRRKPSSMYSTATSFIVRRGPPVPGRLRRRGSRARTSRRAGGARGAASRRAARRSSRADGRSRSRRR